jgi:hypothetical protein
MITNILQYYQASLIKIMEDYMQEIPFSVPISGVIKFDDGSITITINRAETMVSFQPLLQKQKRILLEKGRTLFDIVLETAQELVRRTNENRFSAAQLYGVARERYPELKRNSWVSHVVASAPSHSSYRHFGARRDFFRYLGNGSYILKDEYLKTPGLKKNKSI